VRTTLGSLAIRLTIAVTVCGTTARAVAADSLLRPSSKLTQLALPPANYPTTETPSLNEPISPSAATNPHDDVEYPEPRQPIALFDSSPIDADESYYDSDSLAVGQYPDNWLWGAGGSPYRTGPGWMDDWKVGPMWDTSVDGMTLFRDDANLAALEAASMSADPSIQANQFNYGGGARVYTMGRIPVAAQYQLQFGYEGTEEWNAALLFPEVEVDAASMTDQLRSLHYRSSLHSAEFNFYRRPVRPLRPFWGFRYLRFADELTDSTNQVAPFPLAVVPMSPPAVVVTEDDFNFIDIKNNLIGFQVGLREDLWQLNQRFSLQGFANAGVYYNHIQFSSGNVNSQTVLTSAVLDDPMTMELNEATSGSTTTTSTSLVSSSEPSDVAYMAEVSITGICRLNRCVALRGGYQLFWIDGLRLAEDAYLGDMLGRHNFVMQGWHVGVEYRR
jgi:hypothetical protein